MITTDDRLLGIMLQILSIIVPLIMLKGRGTCKNFFFNFISIDSLDGVLYHVGKCDAEISMF